MLILISFVVVASLVLDQATAVSRCFADCRSENHEGLRSPREDQKCRSWNGFVGCLKTCEGGAKLVSDMRVEMGKQFAILDDMCGIPGIGRNTDFDRGGGRGGSGSRGSSRTSSWGSRGGSIGDRDDDDDRDSFGGGSRRGSIGSGGGSRRGSIGSGSDKGSRRGSFVDDDEDDETFGGGSRRGSIGDADEGSRRGSAFGDGGPGSSFGSRRGSSGSRGDSQGGSSSRVDDYVFGGGSSRRNSGPKEWQEGSGTIKVIGSRGLTDEEERSPKSSIM